MGCQRKNIYTASDKAVDKSDSGITVYAMPEEAREGQMTFYNRGSTNIFFNVQGNPAKPTDYYIYLPAGKTYTEEGVIPGKVTVNSDVNGGVFSVNFSFST